MTFNYPNLTTVSYNNSRWYDTPYGYYPSITTILGHTVSEEKAASLKAWRDGIGHEEADRITKDAADHGTLVHLLCERFLKGQKVDALVDGAPPNARAMASFNSLKFKLRAITAVYGQEVALYSRRFELGGRCDVAGEWNGVPSIIDFKTARRIKGYDDIHDYKVQLAFYGAAHNEMFGTDIKQGIVIMASDSGFPQEFKVNLEEHYEELASRAARFWADAVNKAA